MKDFWFKRRRYGYGWIPVTWQGWASVLVYVSLVIGLAFVMEDELNAGNTAAYFIFFLVSTLLLITIGYYKGPKPKWRWGSKSTDNPEEDW